jgi:hypothetical protein
MSFFKASDFEETQVSKIIGGSYDEKGTDWDGSGTHGIGCHFRV